MGRHHKPSTSHTGRAVAAISISGAFAAIPLTQGTALASDHHATLSPSDDWDSIGAAISKCESNNNPVAHNPRSSASGKWQLLRGTWASVGGLFWSPTAAQATEQEQAIAARRLFDRDGTTPWKASESCWRNKVGHVSPQVTDVSLKTSLPAKHGHGHKKKHGKHAATTPTPAVAPAVTPTVPATYTVRAGDSLSRIAAEHGGSWQQLWALNRATVANPALIHVGQMIALGTTSGPVPTPLASSAADKTAAGDAGTHLDVDLTGYSFQDNQGSNNATISQPVIHSVASGTGTSADPITVASPGSAGNTESPKGTRFYSPKLQKYLIVEDSGATKESTRHLDVWVGGQGGTKSATDACESSFTGKSDVIENPPAGLPVTAGPIFANGQCNVPGGGTSAGSAASSGSGHHHKSGSHKAATS